MNDRACMQTMPCSHVVLCRACFVRTIQSAVKQRQLPLTCVMCRQRIMRVVRIPDVTPASTPATAPATAPATSSVTTPGITSTYVATQKCERRHSAVKYYEPTVASREKREEQLPPRLKEQLKNRLVAAVSSIPARLRRIDSDYTTF